MSKIKSFIWVVIAMILLSACSSTGSNSAPAESGAISGTLSFYTSQPDQDAQTLVDAFKKKYPGVEVNIFRSGTEEVISKLRAEQKAGSVQADVLLVADAVTFESLKKDQLLLSYKSKELTEIPSELVDADGMYAGTKVMATALVINKNNVKKQPTSWKVLVDPSTKDRSIMPSPLYSGAAAYNLGVLTRNKEFTWSYYEELQKNNVTVTKGNGAVLKAVAAGEKDYGMVVDFIAARAEKEGSPVTLVYPSEGVPVITEPIGILKDAKNAPAAKAFVDFVLSEEGQKLASSLGYTPIRKGVKAPAGLKSIDDMKVQSADVAELLSTREVDKKKFSGLFGE